MNKRRSRKHLKDQAEIMKNVEAEIVINRAKF